MKYKLLIPLFLITLSIVSCKSVKQEKPKQPQWYNMAIANDVEIYVDTANIKRDGAVIYATEKRVFLTPESKGQYLDKIRAEYEKMGKPDKMKKWGDFSYCTYHSLYECTNRRFRILSVEDYDSTGKLIVKTKPPKDKIKWLNVEQETVGDYTFFFVCDYDQ